MNAPSSTGLHQVAGGRHVLPPALRLILLTVVGVGHGGRMDDVGGLLLAQYLLHLSSIGHI